MSEPMTVSDKDAQTAEEQERGYWLYVPGEGAGKWEEFRTAGIMALNWDRIGDPPATRMRKPSSRRWRPATGTGEAGRQARRE